MCQQQQGLFNLPEGRARTGIEGNKCTLIDDQIRLRRPALWDKLVGTNEELLTPAKHPRRDEGLDVSRYVDAIDYDTLWWRKTRAADTGCWPYAQRFIDDGVEILDLGEVAVGELPGDGLTVCWLEFVEEFPANFRVFSDVVENPGHRGGAGVGCGYEDGFGIRVEIPDLVERLGLYRAEILDEIFEKVFHSRVVSLRGQLAPAQCHRSFVEPGVRSPSSDLRHLPQKHR